MADEGSQAASARPLLFRAPAGTRALAIDSASFALARTLGVVPFLPFFLVLLFFILVKKNRNRRGRGQRRSNCSAGRASAAWIYPPITSHTTAPLACPACLPQPLRLLLRPIPD
jgi:hypothetical protein